MIKRIAGAAILAGVLSCGARTSIGELPPPPIDASRDAELDDAMRDVLALEDVATDATDAPGGAACSQRTNTGAPVDQGAVQGAAWLAWKIVLPRSELVAGISLHDDGGEVAILSDASGRPGATLSTAPGPSPLPIGWHEHTLSPPVLLEADTTYWVAHGNADSAADLSYDSAGQTPPYWGAESLDGPWCGPFVNYAFDVQLYGTCPGP